VLGSEVKWIVLPAVVFATAALGAKRWLTSGPGREA